MATYSFTQLVIGKRTGLNPRRNFKLGIGTNHYITIKDIHEGKVVITDKTETIDDDALALIQKRSKLKKGDILFASIGRIGETAIVEDDPKDWNVNESVFVFTVDASKVLPDFFCFLLGSQKVADLLNGKSTGSTFRSIKMGQLEQLSFKVPSLDEQAKIVSDLSRIHRAIGETKAAVLEMGELIKSRFVEMFGDEQTILSKWPFVNLKDASTFLTSGSRGWAKFASKNGPYFLTIKNVKNGQIFLNNATYVNPPSGKETQRVKVEENDLLISITADLGRTGIVSKDVANHGAYVNQHLALVRLKLGMFSPKFVSSFLESPEGKEQFSRFNSGSVKAGMNFNSVLSITIPRPPLEDQQAFVLFTNQVDKLKFSFQKEEELLNELLSLKMHLYFD